MTSDYAILLDCYLRVGRKIQVNVKLEKVVLGNYTWCLFFNLIPYV